MKAFQITGLFLLFLFQILLHTTGQKAKAQPVGEPNPNAQPNAPLDGGGPGQDGIPAFQRGRPLDRPRGQAPGGGRNFKRPPPPSRPVAPSPSFDVGKTNRQRPNFADANLEDITNENFPELVESFDFPNADIGDVIKAISELTGKNFIIDPGVRGKITIIAPSRVTVAEAYQAFLSALAVNNLTVVPAGKFLKIKSTRNAKSDSELFTGSYTPNSDQMITRLVQLKHIKAAEVNQVLRSMISQGGLFLNHDPTNTLIITDFGSNISRMMKVIEQIDVSNFNEQLAVIPIRFAKAKDIADLISKIINKGEPPAGPGRPNIPRYRRGQKAGDDKKGSSFSLVLPDDRTNSIIVLGNRQGISEIRQLVTKLDFDINPEDAGGLYVYYVKHGKAEDIANTLNGITSQAAEANRGRNTKAPPPRPGGLRPPLTNTTTSSPNVAGLLGGEVKVTSSEQTNSLIIAASRQDYEVVLNLLSKIDIPRDQVFVEAVIFEMAVNDTLKYGLSLIYFQPGANGLGRAGFVAEGALASFTNVLGTTGLVSGIGFGDDVNIPPLPGLSGASSAQAVTVKSQTGFLEFLKTITKTNVLSTPQILAMDNAEAEIEVGERIPTGQNSTIGVGGQQSFQPQYEDVTIKLAITPQISSDQETVRLEIDQQVQQVVSREIPVTTSKRSLKSDVVVRNGDTIVIGGLMKDSEAPIISKIPILGDIPLLGWLFKSKRTTIDKLNLLIFLTPRIIKTRSDARRLSDFKLKERLQFIKDTGGEDFHGRKVEEIRIANSSTHTATEDLLEESIEALENGADVEDNEENDNDSSDSFQSELDSIESDLPDDVDSIEDLEDVVENEISDNEINDFDENTDEDEIDNTDDDTIIDDIEF